MNDALLTIWITVTIFTIIPNILLAHKFYARKVDDIVDAGFFHYICLFMFSVSSMLVVGNIVWLFISK